MGMKVDEEVTSPFSKAVAYAHSLKRHRAEEAQISSPSKKLHKQVHFAGISTANKFLYIEKGSWVEFPEQISQGLCTNLKAGKVAVKLFVESCSYLINFVRMVVVNSRSGYGRSIAWVDSEGRLHSPSRPYEGPYLAMSKQKKNKSRQGKPRQGTNNLITKSIPNQKEEAKFLERKNSLETHSTLDQQTPNFDIQNSCSGENDLKFEVAKEGVPYEMDEGDSSSQAISGTYPKLASKYNAGAFVPITHKVHSLEEGSLPFEAVKKVFLAGNGGRKVAVKAIYDRVMSDKYVDFRRQTFEMQKKITLSLRGNANVKYAWFGASKSVLCDILLHGFGQPTISGRRYHGGIGVHFSASECSSLSMTHSVIDEKGEQHMLLCQVILGATEKINPGSDQWQPSTEDYDSAVDDLDGPKCYCVWSTHMNTHIFPQYLISFEVSHELPDRIQPSAGLMRCTLPDLNLRENEVLLVQDKPSPHSPRSALEHVQESNADHPVKKSFLALCAILQRHIPTASVAAVMTLLKDYKAQKVPREQLMLALNQLVGRDLLLHCIQEMKVCTLTNLSDFPSNTSPKPKLSTDYNS